MIIKMKNILQINNRKENKMKKLTAIITISLFAIGTTLFAQSRTTQIGSSYFHSDGSSTTKIGSSYFNSNGSSTTPIGSSYFHSEGSSTTRIGDTYFNSKKERTPTYILDNKKKSDSKSLFDW